MEMQRKPTRAELERENQALRKALLDQWEEAHFDHCGRWPHKPGQRCHWPPPIVLGEVRSAQNET